MIQCHRVAQVLANLSPLLLEPWICSSLEAISSILHVCMHVGRGSMCKKWARNQDVWQCASASSYKYR